MHKQKTKDMTQGNPLKLLLLFALPLFLGNTFQQLYSVVDTAIVGRGMGVDSLAAVGSTGSILWMVNGFIIGITHGFSIHISQRFGSGNKTLTKKSVCMSLYLSIFLSAVISVLSIAGSEGMMRLIGTPENIFDEAVLYLNIMFGGMVATILYNTTAAVLRAFGNSTIPLIVIIIGTFVNIGLDLLFILVFGWGVAGAAIATVLSNLLCGIICLISLLRIPELKMEKEDFAWDTQMAVDLIKIGLPVGIMNSITALGSVLMQRAVNRLGSTLVAAYTLGNRVVCLTDNASCTMCGMAMSTYVGQNIGAGNMKRVRQGLKSDALISLGTGILIGCLLIFLGKPIMSLFVTAEDYHVVNEAYPFLFACGLMDWALCFLFMFRFALQGLGDTVVPMFSGVLELFLRGGAAVLLPASLGFTIVCIAEGGTWFGTMIFLGAAYFYRMKKLARNFPEE